MLGKTQRQWCAVSVKLVVWWCLMEPWPAPPLSVAANPTTHWTPLCPMVLRYVDH